MRTGFWAAPFMLAVPCAATAQTAPTLPAVHDAAAQLVAQGVVPGTVIYVAQGGKVRHFEAIGNVVVAGTPSPLSTKTVFWLASMAKPITASAILLLVEQGKIGLDDPLGKYIPEFNAPMMVRMLKPGSPPPPPPGPPGPSGAPAGPPPEYDMVPATRAITIRNLLTHRSGLLSDPMMRGAPIAPGQTLAAWAPSVAKAPLEIQPGSKWVYNNAAAFTILGRVVEIASGQPYDVFLQSHLFTPLGMTHTSFGPSKAGADALPVPPGMLRDPAVKGDIFKSGAAGIWASLDDYSHFAQMLAGDGSYNGKRILSVQSARMLHTNQVGGMFDTLQGRKPSPGLGFGFAVAIVTDPAAAQVSVPAGSFGWAGGGGTRFWVSQSPNRVVVMYAPPPKAQAAIEAAVTTGLAAK